MARFISLQEAPSRRLRISASIYRTWLLTDPLSEAF